AYGGLAGADVKVSNLATLYGRAGYARDKWMVYGLLGYSWADGKVSYDAGGSDKASIDGVTYGIGGEYRINPNWSAYAEATRTDFGTIEKTDGQLKGDMDLVKVGVNYHF
ncbi:MAG TPA: outer membrane beta-barrel protein, partial [Paenirhodobacter sp.]